MIVNILPAPQHPPPPQKKTLEVRSKGQNSTFSQHGQKKVSEYDQEISQSQPQTTPWHRDEEPLNHHETTGKQIKQSNQLSLPHQDN